MTKSYFYHENSDLIFIDLTNKNFGYEHEFILEIGLVKNLSLDELKNLCYSNNHKFLYDSILNKKITVDLSIKDIVFFDLETTGKSTSKDRICQMSFIKTDYSFKVIDKKKFLVNPTIPIPLEASEVHGIYDKDVANAHPFSAYAKNLYNYIVGLVLAGYNIKKFDIPLLIEEFGRCEIDFNTKDLEIIDCLHVFYKYNPRDLKAAVKFYAGYELENAHDAEADVLATIDVVEGQTMFHNLTVDDLIQECKYDENNVDLDGKIILKDGIAVFNFGKHKDKPVKNHPDFVQWMLGGDFTTNTKNVVKSLI